MQIPDVAPYSDSNVLRREIIDACRYLSDLGFCIGTWGNVSVRVEEGILLTPSRVNYDIMALNDLVIVDWNGIRISGTRPPTSEMQLHRILLQRRPDLGAIVHTHSPFASAVACAHKTIPVSSEDMGQIIGGEVRCTPYISGDKHIELAEAAYEAMGDQCTAVLLANHGPVVGGRDLAEAVVAARVLEKAAQMFIFANIIGGCIGIPEDGVANERYRYLFKYGRE